MQCVMEQLNAEIKLNPNMIDKLLDDKFNWDSLANAAKQIGFDISTNDVDEYFKEKYPDCVMDESTKFFVQDEEVGEFRQLTEQELGAVSGGTTVVGAVVAVIVYVAAVVATAAMMVSAVMAAQTVAIGAWAVVAVGIFVGGQPGNGGVPGRP